MVKYAEHFGVWILGGVLVGLILLLMAGLLYSPCTPGPRASTISRLKHVYYVIRKLEEANHATIGQQLRGIAGDATLQRKWELLLLENAGWLEIEEKDIRKFLCRDGYGNLFNVDFTTNVIAHAGSPSLTNIPFDVVVWSSGRNGANEFGNGDDIVLSPLAPNK